MKLGLSLALAICLHDIPEGISMAVPMKNGGMKISKVIFYVILSGITTGIGAFFGAIVGSISQEVISICLSFAAGAMLYIVSGELIPIISWENDSCRKYDRFYNRNFCYNVIAKKCLKNLQFLLTFNIKNNIIIKNLKSILEKEKKCKKY